MGDKTKIQKSAFYKCNGLKNVYITDENFEIEEEAFSSKSVDVFIYLKVEGGYKLYDIINHDPDKNSIVVPDKTDEKDIVAIADNAFIHCSDITNFTIPRTVVEISDGVFSSFDKNNLIINAYRGSYCEKWGKTNGYSINLIGVGVYNGWSYEIYDDGIASIFAYEGNAKTIEVPNEINGNIVKKIDDYLFYGNDSITEIRFPNTIEIFGKQLINDESEIRIYAPSDSEAYKHFTDEGFTVYSLNWSYNESTKTLTVGGNDVIDNRFALFYDDCKGFGDIENIIVKSDVEILGEGVFSGFSKLKNVSFESGSSLSEIGESAFEGCTSLKEITIPETVEIIDPNAFKGCTVFKIKANVKRKSFSHQWCEEQGFDVALIKCFVNGYWTYELKANNEAELFAYSGTGNSVIIPTKLGSVSITSLDENLFKNNSSITIIEIPESVKYISEKTFDGLDLEKIEFTVVHNSYAYKWVKDHNLNYKLKNVYTNGVWTYETVDRINATLISYGGDDTIVSVPETITLGYNTIKVTQVDGELFNNNKIIKEVILPSSITTIHAGAFANSSLEKITIPGNNTVIEKNTSDNSDPFTGIKNLKVITVKNSKAYSYAKSKGYNLFFLSDDWNYDQSTGTLTLTGAINDRDEYPPEWVDLNVKKVVISKDIETIGDSAFAGMSTVKTISFEEGAKLTEIGKNAFANCSRLSLIELPNTLKSIGSGAFENCHSLKTIEIPNSLNFIGSNAFEGCDNTCFEIDANSYALTYAKENSIDYKYNGIVLTSDNTSISIKDQVYSGKPLKPSVEVKYGYTTLKQDVDYIVQYSNNVTPGVGIAKIMFIGLYSGVVEKEFAINPYGVERTFTYKTGTNYATVKRGDYISFNNKNNLWIELAILFPDGSVDKGNTHGNLTFRTNGFAAGTYLFSYDIYSTEITYDIHLNKMYSKGSYRSSGKYFITAEEADEISIPELK